MNSFHRWFWVLHDRLPATCWTLTRPITPACAAWFIRGSCSRGCAGIRLNTDLAKKPRECLEYIVVHEMAHLLEPTHNSRFLALLDLFMPNWRFYREVLNRLPVRHEHWLY